MFLGPILISTLVGIAAAFTALVMGAPVWLALVAWWASGTAILAVELIVLAARPDPDKTAKENLALA